MSHLRVALTLAMAIALPAMLTADGSCAATQSPAGQVLSGTTAQHLQTAQRKKVWCCCRGCCAFAYDCKFIPGCPRC